MPSQHPNTLTTKIPITIAPCLPTDLESMATCISRAMSADLLDTFQFGTNYEKAMKIKMEYARKSFPSHFENSAKRLFGAYLCANGSNVSVPSEEGGKDGRRGHREGGEGKKEGRGEMVGFAVVTFLEERWVEEEEEEKEAAAKERDGGGGSGFPEGMNVEFAGWYYGEMDKKKKDLLRGQRHAVLSALHILPEYQRLGIGSALLHWGFHEFALDRWKIFLGTQMRGRNLYRRWGWTDVDYLDVDFSEPRWGAGKLRGFGVHRSPFMVRELGEWRRVEVENE